MAHAPHAKSLTDETATGFHAGRLSDPRLFRSFSYVGGRWSLPRTVRHSP